MTPLRKVLEKTELWKWRRKVSGCQELEEGLETEAAGGNVESAGLLAVVALRAARLSPVEV